MRCRCGAIMHAFPIPHPVPASAPHGARPAGTEAIIYHCGGTTGCGEQVEVPFTPRYPDTTRRTDRSS